MAWRLAKSLDRLRQQVNAFAPQRSRVSDGTIGDTAHASRASDHNPNEAGVVTALDLTHDPQHGCDAEAIADALVASRDARIKYLIWNRRIVRSYAKPGIPAWKWAPYGGANAHTKHVHISVGAAKAAYDDDRDWTLPHVAG